VVSPRVRWGLAAATLAATLLTPTLARAAGGGVSAETFRQVLFGFLIVAIAYGVSHLLFERLARRFGLVSGVEYLLVGALIGPALGLVDTNLSESLRPVLVLGTGALGMLAGAELRVRDGGFQWRDAVSALIISITTILVVGVAPAVGLLAIGRHDLLVDWATPLLIVSAIAMVADDAPVRAFVTYLDAKGPAIDRAMKVARLASALAILGVGIVFAMADGLHPGIVRDLPSILREFGLEVGMGTVLGLLFTLFLRQKLAHEQRLTVLVGMVIFASGFAYYAHASAIFVNFLAALIVANASSQGDEIRAMLADIRRPFYIALFFFAGFELPLDVPWWSWSLAIPFLFARLFGRWLGGSLVRNVDRVAPNNCGSALAGTGGLAIAMLLNVQLFYGGLPTVQATTAALLLALALSEVASYSLVRRWMLDAADVPPERARRRGDFAVEGR
jgi:Kef-type K+ transport system membrane component KefB